MTIELTFYTTEGCHLCEDAKALLQQLLAQAPERYQLEMIDIASSNELIEQYGTRIPVIKIVGENNDLGWPFDLNSLKKHIHTH